MGWLKGNQEETARRMEAVLAPSVPPDEDLVGTVYALQQSRMSATLYALGVTRNHLIVQEVDRNRRPSKPSRPAHHGRRHRGQHLLRGPAAAGRVREELEDQVQRAGTRLRAHGARGTTLEDALAGAAQRDGLGELAEFLRRCRAG